MREKKLLTALLSCLLFLSANCCPMAAYAEVALPEGAVKGLPEKLTAMDSDGNVVSSSTGEYFFRVENMDYGVTYTKDVQLMNLRDDKAYHIYFFVEPLFKNGDYHAEPVVVKTVRHTARIAESGCCNKCLHFGKYRSAAFYHTGNTPA